MSNDCGPGVTGSLREEALPTPVEGNILEFPLRVPLSVADWRARDTLLRTLTDEEARLLLPHVGLPSSVARPPLGRGVPYPSGCGRMLIPGNMLGLQPEVTLLANCSSAVAGKG